MNQNEFPRMVYKTGGTEEIHGGRFATLIVHDTDELAAALAGGWQLTTAEAAEAPERERRARLEAADRAEEERARALQAQAEADAQAAREAAARELAEQAERDRTAAEERAAAAAQQEQADNAPPTRAELEAKAAELGIEFSPRIGDAKLAERIAAALAQA